MKLTKETAIILTYQLWKWMQDSGGAFKKNWPGFQVYGNMTCFCPCCEYEEEENPENNMDCIGYCPLLSIWPTEEKYGKPPCCRDGSPYRGFENGASIMQKTAIVNKMVTAIEGEMKRLGIKNREIKV